MKTKINLKKVKDLINNSQNILITSHYGPDGDAISSVLAVYKLLKEKDKNISIIIEDSIPKKFSILKNFNKINKGNLVDYLKSNSCDLVILCDVPDLKRVSLKESEELVTLINELSIKTLCIDHHYLSSWESNFDSFINWGYSSTAETIYELFINKLGYEVDKELADILMTGLLSDTNRFLYGDNETYPKTFSIATKLISLGVNIENLSNSINRISYFSTIIISELIKNIQVSDLYTYSFLSDEFCNSEAYQSIPSDDRKSSKNFFIDSYIRNIEKNMWGFIVYKDIDVDNNYKGSFRSVRGVVDTTVFTTKLGGGGHKPASGFRFTSTGIDEAIRLIQQVITENLSEAKRKA